MSHHSAKQTWAIREQTVTDPASGLTFQFNVVPGSSAPFRLRVLGALPNGSRELVFAADGKAGGAGTCLAALCGLAEAAE